MSGFRDAPEAPGRLMKPSGRGDEIGFAERELREMQIGLRAALRQREHLAALGAAVTKINHDLRNALSSAQLVSDRLTDSPDPQVQRVAPTLVRAIDRAVDLCAQTLEYARGQEHELKIARFELAQMVDETIQALTPALPATALVSEVPRPFPIDADRAEIERNVTNLLRNASQAGAKRAAVRAARSAAGVGLDVIDDGPGLSDETRARLFEPFAAGRKGGTGLGLAIVRDLVQAHGGTVHALEAASGAHFHIDLPRA
jgi:signal transduction histidine kinase